MGNKKNKYFDVHGPVFWPASILIIIFIAVTLIVGEPMEKVFTSIQTGISDYAGWFLILAANAFLVFSIVIGFSKYGKIRIGGPEAEPEFSTAAWFAMLFSAGMGIGIIFWGVAEPMFHYIQPPIDQATPSARAEQAMTFSFLHWGLHAWGIYALVGLSLAFFAYTKKLPLTIRSVFYPILKEKIHGWIGDVIDVTAVIATLFGLATSLGLGVQQVSSGVNYLFNIPDNVWTQVVLIAIITAIATASVVLGIDKGVKFLSELNIKIGAIFLLFIIVVGPTFFILDSYIENLGSYIQDFFYVSFWTEAYEPADSQGWQNSWTVFYWAWWISWSPFVGMFIARVSKGRTVREFVTGVLIVPSLLTFLWMTAFGGTGIWVEMNNPGIISESVMTNVSTSLFILLEQFPLSGIASGIGVILVINFFVTSSDSGSLVIDSITAGGKLDAPVGQRIFWAISEGGVAAVLLIGGGLSALQTAAITTGLPFTFVLILMMFSLYKGLQNEHAKSQQLSKESDIRRYSERIEKLISKRKEIDKKKESSKKEKAK
ncbi:BCCT family transporter [Marinigracilibium pacificum]|uniref:BCCT family transporter n=1 Tax=Marinigracilibium pacificum TaxID=2729599 RepID=A0A848J0R0_9BACT|nr:BCCT family transporter [Marinigracilibium pacificum]NMM48948.1 BCCT family transporter [Marinigracilibium pacificum]